MATHVAALLASTNAEPSAAVQNTKVKPESVEKAPVQAASEHTLIDKYNRLGNFLIDDPDGRHVFFSTTFAAAITFLIVFTAATNGLAVAARLPTMAKETALYIPFLLLTCTHGLRTSSRILSTVLYPLILHGLYNSLAQNAEVALASVFASTFALLWPALWTDAPLDNYLRSASCCVLALLASYIPTKMLFDHFGITV